jgi:hypothetical protein
MRLHTNLSVRKAGTAPALAAALGSIFALLALLIALAPRAEAVERVGPIVPEHGYPAWYEDSSGLRLELCIDGPPLCLEGLPDPGQPALVAADPADSNFPDEAFWWAGEADMALDGGGDALLVLAREAAFGGGDEAVRDGDQVSFSRVRIRATVPVAGATYKVTHPYGTDTFEDVPGGTRGINFSEDLGCALSPDPAEPRCDFSDAFFGRVDPFLTWDPAVAPAPPEGYVGDPNVGHPVVGSPFNTNFFRVERTTDAQGDPLAQPIVIGQTNSFFVQGKIAGAAPTAATLNAAPSRVTAGRPVTLSGKLTSFGGPLADKPVVLTRRPAGTTGFRPFAGGNLTTSAQGAFRLTGIRPRRDTTYRVTFAGEPGALLRSSAVDRVDVR